MPAPSGSPQSKPSTRIMRTPRLRLGMTTNSNRLTHMNMKSIARFVTLLVVTQGLAGCSRFVWHEDPFTPDPAPASETLVTGRDTTYVLRGSTYYLLAS